MDAEGTTPQESDETPEAGGAAVWTAAFSALRRQRAATTIEHHEESGPAPLTDAQISYWRQCARTPRRAAGSIAYAIPIEGPLDVDVLRGACAAVFRRQHALRTTFLPVDGQPMQQVAPEPAEPFAFVDDPARSSGAGLDRLIDEHAAARFNLIDGPVCRATLVRETPERHHFLLAAHHLVWDGWSWALFERELRTAWDGVVAGAAEPLPALPVQITDVARWQQSDGYRAIAEKQLAHWRETLDGTGPAPRLLGDKPSRAGTSSPERQFLLPAGVIQSMRALRRDTGVSLFMIVVACFHMLSRKYTGAEDGCIHSLMANRTRQETRRLIGPCYNSALIRIDGRDDPTFTELLERVRTNVHAALANLDVAGQRVRETLIAERRLRPPATRVQLDWHTVAMEPARLGDLTFGERRKPVREGPTRTRSGKPMMVTLPEHMDLLIHFVESREEISMQISHRPESLSIAQLNKLVTQYRAIMLRACGRPDRRLSALVKG